MIQAKIAAVVHLATFVLMTAPVSMEFVVSLLPLHSCVRRLRGGRVLHACNAQLAIKVCFSKHTWPSAHARSLAPAPPPVRMDIHDLERSRACTNDTNACRQRHQTDQTMEVCFTTFGFSIGTVLVTGCHMQFDCGCVIT